MGKKVTVPVLPDNGEVPLGMRIRIRRLYVGLDNLRVLADKVGCDRSHLSHIETGKINPSKELLQVICSWLQITPEELRSATREDIESWRNSLVHHKQSNQIHTLRDEDIEVLANRIADLVVDKFIDRLRRE